MSEARADEGDEVTLAIETAKAFLLRAFRDEKIQNLALEEVRPDPYKRIWDITLGFHRARPIPTLPNEFLQIAAIAAAARPPREYKVVRVDMDAKRGVSIVNRKED